MEYLNLIIAVCAAGAAVLSVLKSAKSLTTANKNKETATENTKILNIQEAKLIALATNDLKHLKADVEELKKRSDESDKRLSEKCEGIEKEVAQLYTSVGRIDERCKANHK